MIKGAVFNWLASMSIDVLYEGARGSSRSTSMRDRGGIFAMDLASDTSTRSELILTLTPLSSLELEMVANGERERERS
jgi:hypothetical protein